MSHKDLRKLNTINIKEYCFTKTNSIVIESSSYHLLQWIDTPFTNGHYSYDRLTTFFSLPTNNVYSDAGILLNSFLTVASSYLADQINQNLFTLSSNPDCGPELIINNSQDCEKISGEDSFSSIIIQCGVCWDYGIFNISNNPCLQYIKIEDSAMQITSSLIFSNNPVLKAIRIGIDAVYHSSSSLIMTSTQWKVIIMLDLPQLTSFRALKSALEGGYSLTISSIVYEYH